MSPDPDEDVRARLYSAQRQFDLATILVATTAYAVIFALLQFIRASIAFAALAAVFIAIIAFAQAFFFQENRPRLASALAGATFFVVVIAVTRTLDASPTPRGHDITQYFPIVLVGMFWGYVTGTLIGSAFMAADILRKHFFQRKS